ncbi:hypothetical protein CLU79DRAFT_724048 [Phycomyces nitens]|nr:hypothetical protein CLU79DRAFT_724048 [Phycomyces nitens]
MPSKKHAIADDDFEPHQLNVRLPEVCVDYLSYKFDEMDLAASWRVMTKKKKTVVDGIRLENASWRTWAKTKNNLKTISPQTLNWLKDSDVTWLYGPLHTVIKTTDEDDRFAHPRVATAEETLGLMTSRPLCPNAPITPQGLPLKSALKKVTMADLLKRSATELRQNEAEHEEWLNHQKHYRHQIQQKEEVGDTLSPIFVAGRHTKLRFNHHVEQCIALPDDENEIRPQAMVKVSLEETPKTSAKTACPRSSIKIIAPARLKHSQPDDLDSDELSPSIRSFTEDKPSEVMISEQINDKAGVIDSEQDPDNNDDDLRECLAGIDQRGSTHWKGHSGQQKDPQDISEASIFSHIAHWASSYLWPGRAPIPISTGTLTSSSSSLVSGTSHHVPNVPAPAF